MRTSEGDKEIGTQFTSGYWYNFLLVHSKNTDKLNVRTSEGDKALDAPFTTQFTCFTATEEKILTPALKFRTGGLASGPVHI